MKKPRRHCWMFLLLGCFWAAGGGSSAWGAEAALEPAYRQAIEADWARQEKRLGRRPDEPAALQAALGRASHYLAPALLAAWSNTVARAHTLPENQRLALYQQIRWATREAILQQPELRGKPILFLKRNRFICQMLHEYMGYFYDYGNVPPGGGVYVLENPGRSFAIRDLIQGRLPAGNYTTLALSLDARRAYFAFAERAPGRTPFTSPERRGFNLYALDLAEGGHLTRLTHGSEDDFDPCPLPDGGLAFMSTRRGGFARCNNRWEPTASYTLHRMDADGKNIRLLSCHETAEWHPSVLNDGRIVYIRWDYVDRSAANFHGLWACQPDGSGVTALFGNYTMRINACYQPKAIPGSDKIVFIAGAHHADVGGALVLLDPSRVRLDAATGEDRFDSLQNLTPELCYAEADGWPKSYFHSPHPLNEQAMLVSFSFDPLPGMSSGESRDTRTGLYYFDRHGTLELLYFDPAISSMYPHVLTPPPPRPQLASNLDPALGAEGEFLLADVRQSLMPFPAGRRVVALRVFQLLPKFGSHTVNDPRIGHANAENARALLGTVPVEADGSAYFRVPARKPLYFQAVDESGRAVQTMRSAAYVQPGERRACVGCHEPIGTAAPVRPLLAARRPPSRLEPGPEGCLPFSYPRLVQPVLERNCVRCHDGSAGPGKSTLALTDQPEGPFTRSYQNLKKYLRWYEWGGASISQIASLPGRAGADASPLTRILEDQNHRDIGLNEADRRALYLWMDANVPFYGTYDHAEQAAQRSGALITLTPHQ
ncbi:MAG: hypothetical protein N3J91_14850 [Verrucomicrobiae bacterium]|nr:hypothetical protein [Verrucomicrobiae bacterium]